jgi:NADH-ubiquinone oxidoreductase chain 1
LSLFFVILQGLAYSLSLGLKSCILIFVFIWVRASFPRIRFDQLMSYCWTILLPIVIGFIILIPCIVFNLSLMPSNFYLI